MQCQQKSSNLIKASPPHRLDPQVALAALLLALVAVSLPPSHQGSSSPRVVLLLDLLVVVRQSILGLVVLRLDLLLLLGVVGALWAHPGDPHHHLLMVHQVSLG